MRPSDRCGAEFDKFEIGRDGYPPSHHRNAGLGAAVVASIWLAFYIVAAIHSLHSGNQGATAMVEPAPQQTGR